MGYWTPIDPVKPFDSSVIWDAPLIVFPQSASVPDGVVIYAPQTLFQMLGGLSLIGAGSVTFSSASTIQGSLTLSNASKLNVVIVGNATSVAVGAAAILGGFLTVNLDATPYTVINILTYGALGAGPTSASSSFQSIQVNPLPTDCVQILTVPTYSYTYLRLDLVRRPAACHPTALAPQPDATALPLCLVVFLVLVQ